MENEYGIKEKIVTLSVFAGLTPRIFESLLRHYGSIDRILFADSGTLMAIDNMSTELANNIIESSKLIKNASLFIEKMNKDNIELITRFDDSYQQRLVELNDPPIMLYCRGNYPDNNKKIVAIAGADNASNEGIELTVKAADKFVEERVQVISSLRKGIDSAALLGVSASGGTAFAVLDSGFENIIPEENIALTNEIINNGALISEYVPNYDFDENHYTQSNRIIAAMSQAVVVTELYKDSKETMDLLECCSEIGKLCFFLIDPVHGALADEESLKKAISCGAIPMVGLDKLDDIILSLI